MCIVTSFNDIAYMNTHWFEKKKLDANLHFDKIQMTTDTIIKETKGRTTASFSN